MYENENEILRSVTATGVLTVLTVTIIKVTWECIPGIKHTFSTYIASFNIRFFSLDILISLLMYNSKSVNGLIHQGQYTVC